MSDMSYALKSVTPILRIFDETKARAFYVDYLGFQIDWEHRFEENLPLYMQISLGACTLHLSEHHGDCCPGAAVRIEAENLEAFHAELGAKDYKYAKPGLETTPWDTRELTVTDPFGNRLIFFEAA
ncbi:glyoxalase superfamily protein [Paenibacillus tyrfis]|uniref:glyoxalase superfamily protein n=1 Tax=Paenibacillus tyrfis TaxID=1501230 RepID=UPI000B590253|nr:glyoxalase superfamily protein [Paenibacillus tyrfis]